MDERTVFQAPMSGAVRPGVRLNGIYEIERLVGEGGMGEVYKGFNIQTRDAVAIKMIRPEMSRNPDAMALFRREASTLHTLQHEGIVRYFVFSVDPDLQRAYLAMEFVDGVSLSTKLAAGPLSLDEVRILKARVGGAMDAAHRLGVVHRDISSDNFILPGGDVRQAKVIDFGIARSHRAGEGTILGDAFAGKYRYASLEQLSEGEVTFKTDIYSFGLVLVEALRGRSIDMGGKFVDAIEKRRSVPDLSDIDPSIRPLLQSMLQPNPADRPASMAAVAEWTASPAIGRDSKAQAVNDPRPASAQGSSTGRLLAIFAALLAIASVAATLYFFRDDLTGVVKPLLAPTPSTPSPVASKPPPLPPIANPTVEPTQVAGPTKPPPLPPVASPTAEATPSPTAAASTATPSPTPTPTPTDEHGPGVNDLLALLAPRAPQPVVSLPPAYLGKPYRSALPAFTDPTGQSLRLEANPAPPDGLTLKDLGQGYSELVGAPVKAGTTTFQVVAANQKAQSAPMDVTIVVTAPPAPVGPTKTATPVAPVSTPTPVVTTPTQVAAIPPTVPSPAASLQAPTASQAVVTLEGAKVESDGAWNLPPFKLNGDAHGLKLRAEPAPPEGLAFVDLGAGAARIEGRPKQAGPFEFDVVASNGDSATGRMTVKLTIAPRQVAVAAPQSTTLLDRENVFLRQYDGGSCFFIRPVADSTNPTLLRGVGADPAEFSRFETAYRHELGVEPNVRAQTIDGQECPALELLRASANSAVPAPRIELTDVEVGSGKPLAGSVTGLSGRHLTLVALTNDGSAHLIRNTVAADGASAQFSVKLTNDAEDVGHTLALLAIVSDKPSSALSAPHLGKASDLVPKLIDEWGQMGGSADVQFARLTK